MFKRWFVLVVLLLSSVPALAQESAGARLRFAHYVLDLAAVDVFVDGSPLAEGLEFLKASPHADVSAGTHEISFVLAGEPVTAPAQIILAPGSDYTIALIGQSQDETLQPVLINESELVASLRNPQAPASYAILLHGISDGPTIDLSVDGAKLLQELSFGEYGVVPISLAPHDILVTFSEEPDRVLFENKGETPPANDLLLLTVMVGSYPDALDVSGAVSRLPNRTVLDFLSTYTDAEGNTFNTLLAALEAAGLSESLAQESAITLFAPTDAAFAALPPETQALLFAYPAALREVLLGHVVDEVFTTRSLQQALTVTSRGGSSITITPTASGLQVNKDAALLFGGFPVVTNGNVIGIDQLLIPENIAS